MQTEIIGKVKYLLILLCFWVSACSPNSRSKELLQTQLSPAQLEETKLAILLPPAFCYNCFVHSLEKARQNLELSDYVVLGDTKPRIMLAEETFIEIKEEDYERVEPDDYWVYALFIEAEEVIKQKLSDSAEFADFDRMIESRFGNN